MKKLYYLILSILAFSIQISLISQNRNLTTEFEWAKRAGSSLNPSWQESGKDITVDNTGHIAAIGDFYNEATFDTISLYDGRGSFIARMDTGGNYLWVNQIKGFSTAKAIASDTDCNYYIIGNFYDTIQLGSIFIYPLVSSQGADVFIAKIDSMGSFIWGQAVGMPSPYYTDVASDIYINELDEVYITGSISGEGSAIFGSITVDLSHGSSQEIFIGKMNTDGSFNWVKTAGGNGDASLYNDIAISISGDIDENIFVTGYYGQDATFGDTTIYSTDRDDVFVTKLDSDGSFLWVRSYGGVDDDWALSIDVDNNGNAYIAGSFSDDLIFGDESLISFGSFDIFVLKVSGDGDELWAHNAGGEDDWDEGVSVIAVNDSTIYLSGSFKGAAHFGTDDVLSTKIGSVWYRDIFVSKIDSSGIFIYTKTAGYQYADFSYSLAIKDSSIYITGTITNSAYFDDIFVEALGSQDIFFAKFIESSVDTTVGVHPVSSQNNTDGIIIYSTSGHIKVNITNRLASGVFVYNIEGKLIKHFNCKYGINSIPIHNKGIYIVKVQNSDSYKIQKVYVH